MNEKVLFSDHIYLTKDLNGIVSTYKKNDEYKKAITFCNTKLAEQRLNLTKNHPRLGHTLQTIGDIYTDRDGTQAFSYYHEAPTIFESCIPPNQQAVADCLEHISDLHYKLCEHDEALKYGMSALDIQTKHRSSQHPNTAVSLQHIDRIYSSIENYSKTLYYFKRELRIYEANYVPEYENTKEVQQCIVGIESKLNGKISPMD